MKLSKNTKRRFNRAAGISIACVGAGLGIIEIIAYSTGNSTPLRFAFTASIATTLFIAGNKIDQNNLER